jgi:hypothetical protein
MLMHAIHGTRELERTHPVCGRGFDFCDRGQQVLVAAHILRGGKQPFSKFPKAKL